MYKLKRLNQKYKYPEPLHDEDNNRDCSPVVANVIDIVANDTDMMVIVIT